MVGDAVVRGSIKLEKGFPITWKSFLFDGFQIDWRTGSSRHWNLDQYVENLRFFSEDSTDGAGVTRITITEDREGTGCLGVGVGTTTPKETLDVHGAVRPNAVISRNLGEGWIGGLYPAHFITLDATDDVTESYR